MHEFTLPIYGVITTTKNNRNKALTLNWCLSADNWAYGSAKKKFSAMIREQIEAHDPIEGKIAIRYTYYAKRRGTDLDNFTAIVCKFFQDCLSSGGLISDDNTNVIVSSSYRFGGLDKDNPRVTAEVIQID